MSSECFEDLVSQTKGTRNKGEGGLFERAKFFSYSAETVPYKLLAVHMSATQKLNWSIGQRLVLQSLKSLNYVWS